MSKSSKLPFARRMFVRTHTVYEQIEEIDRVVTQAVPILEKASAGNQEQIKALEEVVRAMKEYQSLFETGAGHLAELDTTALKHEVANIATFIGAMDIYFAADPETVKTALEKFEVSVLLEALQKLEDRRFRQLFEIFERAKNKRHSASLKEGDDAA